MNDAPLVIRFLSPRNLLAMIAGLGMFMGYVLRSPLLLFVGTVAAAALGASLWRASRLLKTLRVRRRHAPRSFEGEQVPVTLGIENDGSLPSSLIVLEDHFPPGDAWRVHYLIEDPIRRGERVEVQYTGECNRRRGLYTLGPLRFWAQDALGLFRRELAVEEFTLLLVYPSAVDLRMAEVLGDGTLAHMGIETLTRPGTSTEFTGLRPWRAGDAPNTIHWRSTARRGELIVKEFQDETTTRVSFFLDLGRLGLTGIGDQTSLEYAIKATASLARRAIDLAHSVELYAVGKEVEYTPPGKGHRHLLMLLDHLALLKTQGDVDFLDKVIEYVPLLPAGGTAVLVVSASTLRIPEAVPVIARLKARRVLPIIVLVDDRAFIKLYQEQETQHVEGTTLEEAARRLTLEGARVHVVTRAKSPQQALLQGLEREAMSHASH